MQMPVRCADVQCLSFSNEKDEDTLGSLNVVTHSATTRSQWSKAPAMRTKPAAGAPIQLHTSASLSAHSPLPYSFLLIRHRQQIPNTFHFRSAPANLWCKQCCSCPSPIHHFLPELLLEEILHEPNTDLGYRAAIFKLFWTAAQVCKIVTVNFTISSE
jgi:hypothetical protein